MNQPNTSLHYRQKEVSRIVNFWVSGESCQLVGIGSSGKSNLLRFLQQENVRRQYLGRDSEQWLILYIDANKMLRPDAWGLYELILHQLLMALEGERDAAAEAQPEPSETGERTLVNLVEDLHQRACDPNTQHMTLRYLDRVLSLVCNRAGRMVVLLLDEFDELARALPAQAFAALRAMRDDNKYRLMYLLAARRPLAELREDDEIESFAELFNANIVWLGRSTPEDALVTNTRMLRRKGIVLTSDQDEALLALSGCHAGLQRGLIAHVASGRADAAQLALDPDVRAECRQIWRSLPVAEQLALIGLAGSPRAPLDPAARARLLEKGLIEEAAGAAPGGAEKPAPDGALVIFSPVFAAYVAQLPEAAASFELDRRRGVVQINGRRIENLTRSEFACLDYLAHRAGETCTTDAIQTYLDTQDYTKADQANSQPGATRISRARIETLIKRLRERIEPDPKKPRYIVTDFGRGYKLDID